MFEFLKTVVWGYLFGGDEGATLQNDNIVWSMDKF